LTNIGSRFNDDDDPEETETEKSTRQYICRDAARIVVSEHDDDSWPNNGHEKA